MEYQLDFNVLVDRMPESMIVLNPGGEIIFYNQKAKEYEKLAVRKFELGIPLTAMAKPERRAIVELTINKAMRSKLPQVIDGEYTDQAGRFFFLEFTYEPIINALNELEYICVVFREKTHEMIFQRKATDALRVFSNLIEHANAVIFSVDSREYITEWNAECSRITQYHKNEALAEKIKSFIHESNKEAFAAFYCTILQGEPVSNFEVCFKTKGGQPVVVLLNATPKINEARDVVGILFVGHDISELSEYRTSLEQKVKDRTEKLKAAIEKEKELVDLKNRFVSMASHEFRVPLSSISASARDLMQRQNLDENEIEKLHTIDKHVSHMRDLLEDVLSLGKTEVVRLEADLKPLNFSNFLRTIGDEVLINAQSAHTIEYYLPKQEIKILSDEKLLRNIFINLFSNAIKFSPEKKSIAVDVIVDNPFVVVKVIDYGIGIGPEDQLRIFTPFNRGTNAESIKGTGLGLSIVKRAVEALGGLISMESILGHGTTITIKLKIN
jgi:PAS domain S-box-containing protein